VLSNRIIFYFCRTDKNEIRVIEHRHKLFDPERKNVHISGSMASRPRSPEDFRLILNILKDLSTLYSQILMQ